ncbi:hypothetical protein ABZ478_07845 [Streptomyces sp. NPDC005706]|uniref:hypothetical protein n=1 Tax=Streptomyces sp. NPDC005706 TaxID=3157169 RepID=UPI0033F93ED8
MSTPGRDGPPFEVVQGHQRLLRPTTVSFADLSSASRSSSIRSRPPTALRTMWGRPVNTMRRRPAS